MDILSFDNVLKWSELLPDDFSKAMGTVSAESKAALDGLARGMGDLKSPADAIQYVKDNSEAFIQVGTAARVRFLAWYEGAFAKAGREDLRAFIEDGELQAGADVQSISKCMKEDLHVIARTLGKRLAPALMDSASVELVIGAGYQAISSLEMKGA